MVYVFSGLCISLIQFHSDKEESKSTFYLNMFKTVKHMNGKCVFVVSQKAADEQGRKHPDKYSCS